MLEELSGLKEYSKEKHQPIFVEFVKNVHTVIFEQGDMLFDCVGDS